jgi:mannosyltransferase
VASEEKTGRSLRVLLALTAVLLVAALLRLYGLGFESLWLDETVSVRFANLGAPEIVEESKADNNFPTYYLLLHYWVALFGESEFAVRLLSAVIGILAVYLTYAVGAQLFGRGAGVVAALLMAVSPYHVAYSQETRVYNLMALAALVSFYFFLRLREGETGLGVQAGYVLSTAALVYSHVYGLFVVIAQNSFLATVLFTRGPRAMLPGPKRWAILQVLLGLLFVPGVLLLIGWITRPGNRSWIEAEAPPLSSVRADFVEYAGSVPLLVLLLALAGLGCAALLRGEREKLSLLLFWLLAPLALPLVISAVSTPIFVNRYGIAATPALLLLAARGVWAAGAMLGRSSPARSKAIASAIALLLVALSGGVLWRYFGDVDKDQWREAVGYVNREAEPGDLVVVAPDYVERSAFAHYNAREDLDVEGFGLKITPKALKRIGRAVGEHERVWVIVRAEEKGWPSTVKQIVAAAILLPERAYHKRYHKVDLTPYEERGRS